MSKGLLDSKNSEAWSLPGVVSHFEDARQSSGQIYPSEWRFLSQAICENMSVLDVGCAQGGFASVLGEHLKGFSYTGVDISPQMVARARHKFPEHEFYVVPEGTFKLDPERQFDLVVVFGILHLHETWRETLASAWRHTREKMLFDLREWDGETIEDKNVSYMKMDFADREEIYEETKVPYIILNKEDATKSIQNILGATVDIQSYGYIHEPTKAAVTPMAELNIRTWSAVKK